MADVNLKSIVYFAKFSKGHAYRGMHAAREVRLHNQKID